MNVFVFYVNKAEMLSFETSFSFDTVSRLQDAIAEDMEIPVDSQVLLISGGEAMLSSNRVCSYGSGTDTCPIFLFNLRAIEDKNPPEVNCDTEQPDIQHRIEGSINMPPTLTTLSTRTQLAIQLKELAYKHLTQCKSYVQHQHLQHQGWSTVVANLDDTQQSFVQQASKFEEWYSTFLNSKQKHMDMLTEFPKSLEVVSKIPILASVSDILRQSVYQGLVQSDEMPSTVLQLINTLEPDQDLLQEADEALEECGGLDEDLLCRLLDERDKVLQAADNASMKEVRGLEDRLFGLDQLIQNASKLAKDQDLYAQSFVQNQQRCRELAEPNILADLCSSHKDLLRRMGEKDADLRRIVAKLAVAKQELSANLHTRLRWIMFVEKRISSVDEKFVLHYEKCKRLQLHIDKLEQIQRAPVVYAQLCAEVCRRRIFASQYKQYNEAIHDKAKTWHQSEVELRVQFYKTVGQHFLNSLFPGLDELPPTLMVSASIHLDEKLPPITPEDIDSMKQLIPELEQWLTYDSSELSALPGTTQPLAVLAAPNQSFQSHSNSDVTVISPRVASSSSGSSSKVPETEPSIEECGRLPDPDESTSHILHSADNQATSDSLRVLTLDAADDAIFLTARYGSYDSNNEYASLGDEQPPASLTEEDCSGGFMSANFFLSGEVESITHNTSSPRSQQKMADTLTLQNSQIGQLMMEKSTLTNQCQELRETIHKLKNIIKSELQQLRDSRHGIQSELSQTDRDFRNLQKTLLSAVELSQAQHSEKHNKSYKAFEAEKQELLKSHTLQQNGLKDENGVLAKKLDEIQTKYDELLCEVEQMKNDHQRELRQAFQEAADSKAKQLTLEFELELDNLKEQQAKQAEEVSCEIASRDAEIEHLKLEVEQLTAECNAIKLQNETSIENLTKQHGEQLSTGLRELEEKYEATLAAVKKESHEHLQNKMKEMETNKDEALSTLEKEIKEKYENLIQSMKKVTEEAEVNTEEDFIAKELEELKLQLDEENRVAIAQSVADVKSKYLEQLEQERQNHEIELKNRASAMKESLLAVSEAQHRDKLAQLRKEKDIIIAELKKKIKSMSKSESPSPTMMEASTQKEDGAMAESIMPIAHPPSSPAELLYEKDEMIKKLQQQVSAMKMSASSRDVVDKVTVKSVGVGDKVILCYDEKHDHYVVFTLSPTLHFLHAESMSCLGLLPTGPNSKRKSWVMAEIIDKEYCQARKPQNRFKVPVDTKFYRVKAKPWSVV